MGYYVSNEGIKVNGGNHSTDDDLKLKRAEMFITEAEEIVSVSF